MPAPKPPISYLQGILFPVWVGVAFNEADYLNEIKRLGVSDPVEFHSSAASMKAFCSKGRLTLIVCFDPVRNRLLHKNQVAAILAHECVHVSDAIFRQIGEHTPGDETRAYLVQYVLQEILYLMDDYLKKRKPHGKKR